MKPIKHLLVLLSFFLFTGFILAPTVFAVNEQKIGHNPTDTVQAGHDPIEHDPIEHDPGSQDKMIMAVNKEDAGIAQEVKIEERLGDTIFLDAVFKDSTGKQVRLGDLFDKPVVILPIYFMCSSVCNFLQADLANALNQVGPEPGKDFNIISLSFADDEDHTHAATSKQNYMNLVTRKISAENWFYLTGDSQNIRKVTDSLGYYFIKKKDHFYIHPSSMMVLAKDGMITRYLYGPSFLPFDIGMALSEAEKGETGVSIKRGVLAFCFDYDPANKTYVFKTFRITGSAILILLSGFVVFLVYPSKKRPRRRH